MNVKGFLLQEVSIDSNLYIYFVVDFATVIGYLVVSRPFLNLDHPRHLHSTHSERLEVS